MSQVNQRGHIFTKEDLDNILKKVVGKTLGEVDTNNVFAATIKHPKITGIAGDVVEQSILNYPADSYQSPDLIVDGKPVELKTTGLRNVKKKAKNKNISNGDYEAKEPMSITAVSPNKIVHEVFESSNFWHKLEKLLLVYYLYDSESTVPASEYSKFPILGYHFHEFDTETQEILKNDWSIVRNFISELQSTYANPETHYPKISSALRPNLMLIDTAPKWPNRPRFRLKRATVSTIVQKYFGEKFEELDEKFSSFEQLDKKLSEFTRLYKGKTIEELIQILNISTTLSKATEDVNKAITEQIVTKMFGAKSKKISKIELFSEIGLIGKTITQTQQGTRTEDTKLFKIDFNEWLVENTSFEESSVYSNFSERQFLFIIFEERHTSDKLLKNKFLGFKRVTFTESFIENEVKRTWLDVRDKIFSGTLKEEIATDQSGEPIRNKNGVIRTSVNFPKSKDFKVFFRGTGNDSADKPVSINNIAMYRQDLWIKGTELVEMLSRVDYI